MQATRRPAIVAIVAACAIFAVGYFALQCRGGDGASSASLRDVDSAGGRWHARTFHVRYLLTIQERSAEVSWYHDGTSRTRIDLSYVNGDRPEHHRIYIKDGEEVFSCREPAECAVGDDLFDDPHADDLAAIVMVFLQPLSSIGLEGGTDHASTPQHIEISRRQDVFAGVPATCFVSTANDSESRVCFSDEDGIPLLLSNDRDGLRTAFTAKEVVGGVTDADFRPPYPLGP